MSYEEGTLRVIGTKPSERYLVLFRVLLGLESVASRPVGKMPQSLLHETHIRFATAGVSMLE